MCRHTDWSIPWFDWRVLHPVNTRNRCVSNRINRDGGIGMDDVLWRLDLLACFRRTSLGWIGWLGGGIRVGAHPRVGRSPRASVLWDSPGVTTQSGTAQEEKSDAGGCDRRQRLSLNFRDRHCGCIHSNVA